MPKDSNRKGFRRIEFYILITLHKSLKAITEKQNEGLTLGDKLITIGKIANIIFSLGLKRFYEMKKLGENPLREPEDLESGG